MCTANKTFADMMKNGVVVLNYLRNAFALINSVGCNNFITINYLLMCVIIVVHSLLQRYH